MSQEDKNVKKIVSGEEQQKILADKKKEKERQEQMLPEILNKVNQNKELTQEEQKIYQIHNKNQKKQKSQQNTDQQQGNELQSEEQFLQLLKSAQEKIAQGKKKELTYSENQALQKEKQNSGKQKKQSENPPAQQQQQQKQENEQQLQLQQQSLNQKTEIQNQKTQEDDEDQDDKDNDDQESSNQYKQKKEEQKQILAQKQQEKEQYDNMIKAIKAKPEDQRTEEEKKTLSKYDKKEKNKKKNKGDNDLLYDNQKQEQLLASANQKLTNNQKRNLTEEEKQALQTSKKQNNNKPSTSIMDLPDYQMSMQLPYKKNDPQVDQQIPSHYAMYNIGLKFEKDNIIGSSARCVAFLEALKNVVKDYQTSGQDFSRKFDKLLDMFLQKIMTYRSATEGMMTSYKFCKKIISLLFVGGINIDEKNQKVWFCKQIDQFIKTKIIQADDLIIIYARLAKLIQPGEFIMVFARSTVLEKFLIQTQKDFQKDGKHFTVIVVDNPPFHEGKKLLKRLSQEGVSCIYTLLSHVAYLMKKVNKVFVGASSMLSNGALVSRIGTALLACIANDQRKPFVVFCQTYKFSEKSLLDSLTWNEKVENKSKHNKKLKVQILFIDQQPQQQFNNQSSKIKNFSNQNNQKINNMEINHINLRYDLTPGENIQMVVTELGVLPSTSVPHVIREFSIHDYIGKIELPTNEQQQ